MVGDKLAPLLQQRDTLLADIEDIAASGTQEQYAEKKRAFDEVSSKITRVQEARSLAAAAARPVGMPESEIEIPGRVLAMNPRLERFGNGRAPDFHSYVRHVRRESGRPFDRSQSFDRFGEMLQAVAAYSESRGSTADPRLVRAPAEWMLDYARAGASEIDPTGGGFLVQTDFADAIFMLAHDMGELLSRVGKLPISEKANGIKVPGIDESSRATGSRWGGVKSYWAAEASTIADSKPKFRQVEFNLNKLISTMYVTEELMMDSTALGSIASIAFAEEVMFMTEDAIFEGSGAGLPLGFKGCPAVVTVAKQTGQAAGTVVKENLDNMFSRCWARSRKNAVWLINQDVEPQLFSLNQAVGTGGQLVFMPPGGLSGAPYATLFGRPVITTEYSDTVGTAGDIMLADLSQYTMIEKGGVQAAWSMHVAFLTDQRVFRITYRVDGKPMWHTVLTPFKGTATKSPFVALAAR